MALSRWFKAACKDEVWLVCLILPLVFLASANLVQHAQLQGGITGLMTKKSTAAGFLQQELTARQVQVIVSKPIADLMAMQVYDKASRAQNNGELVARYQDTPVINGMISAKKVYRFHLAAAKWPQAWSL